jgi:hypothetical protein
MNLTRDRVHSIGWLAVLLVCLAATVALTLRVNAVKSEVHSLDRKLYGVQRNIDFLETEFQTRASQHALQALNEVEFGYVAPRAGQYIEGERQLASLGALPGKDAPAPIRYASAERVGEDDTPNPILAMVSPVSGKSEAAAERKASGADRKLAAEAVALGGHIALLQAAQAGAAD